MAIFNHHSAEKGQHVKSGTNGSATAALRNLGEVQDPEQYTLRKWPWRPRTTSFTRILQQVGHLHIESFNAVRY